MSLILKSIEEEAEACRAATAHLKVGDWAWLVHHEILAETLTEPIENRISYILENKTDNVALRLRLLRPLVEDEAMLSDAELNKVRNEYIKARTDYYKASAKWYKVRAEYDTVRDEYDKASAADDKACVELNKSATMHYHRLFPDSPWNGKTIFAGEDNRTVVWFSCGAASACAAKLAVKKYQNCHIVYCNTLASEHPDNSRFLKDVEAWVGKPVEIIESDEFKTVEEVWDKRKYMAGVKGAPCTTEMKKVPRFHYQQPDDIHVFGLTADEGKRIKLFEENNPELNLNWILRDAGITKDDCYQIIRDAKIALPVMYSLGFKNNNCIGCVKSSSPAYWDRVRQYFPDIFKRRCEQSREIGARLVEYHGVRIFLDELPNPIAKKERKKSEKDIECGVICLGEQPELIGIQSAGSVKSSAPKSKGR